MGFFNRKKTEPPPFDALSEIQGCLHKLLEHSEIAEGCVLLPAEQLTIRPGITNVKDNFAALYFEVSHPSFEEPFFDMSAGVGKTTSEAIHKAVAGFLFSGFCGVRHCVNAEYEHTLTSTFLGTEQQWDVSESCIAHLGDTGEQSCPPQGGFWSLLAERLPAHLGNRRHYWVKVYASKQQSGEVICECRVNNAVSKELTAKITAFAETWVGGSTITSTKQLFVLTRQGDYATPYPYTREQIFSFTDKAVALFTAADTDEKHEQLTEALTEMTSDSSLATELYCFLPEICAQNAFNEATYGETVVFHRGEEKHELYLDQLGSYRWIQERAVDGFSQGLYSGETFKRMVYSSATCSVLSKALNGGSKMSDLALTSLTFMMPEDYIIR